MPQQGLFEIIVPGKKHFKMFFSRCNPEKQRQFCENKLFEAGKATVKPVVSTSLFSGKNIFFMVFFSWWRQGGPVFLAQHLFVSAPQHICHGNAENRVLKRVGGKNYQNEKVFFICCRYDYLHFFVGTITMRNL